MLKDNILNLFSTPIYKKSFKIKENEKNFLKSISLSDVQFKNGLMSDNKHILHQKQLSSIKNQIDKHIHTYKNDVLQVAKDIEIYITNSWLMRHNKGHYAHEHSHANSIISGIYYVEVPKMSGNLIFHKASNNISNVMSPVVALKYKKYNEYNSEEYAIKTKNNLLVLFPSNLRHSVPVSLSENPRYCIAFNTFLKGDLTTNGVDELRFG
jgi:uncharacterized protein (TIGR02466 family)